MKSCVNCNKNFTPEEIKKRKAVCCDLCLDQAVEYDQVYKSFGEEIALQHWCFLRESTGYETA